MIAAVKWGAIFGVAAYIVSLGVAIFNQSLAIPASASVTDHPVLLVPVCLSIFLLLFAASAAGFYAGRETGVAGIGAIAGIVLLVVTDLLALVYSPNHQSTATSSSPIWTQILAVALDLGIAACMGWIGGRPGASRSPLRAQKTADFASIARLSEPPPPLDE